MTELLSEVAKKIKGICGVMKLSCFLTVVAVVETYRIVHLKHNQLYWMLILEIKKKRYHLKMKRTLFNNFDLYSKPLGPSFPRKNQEKWEFASTVDYDYFFSKKHFKIQT